MVFKTAKGVTFLRFTLLNLVQLSKIPPWNKQMLSRSYPSYFDGVFVWSGITQPLLWGGKKQIASHFKFTYRYIDVLSIDNPDFENYLDQTYPAEHEIKDTIERNTSAYYSDLLLTIRKNGQLHTSFYDERDNFIFDIINFPFMCFIFARLCRFHSSYDMQGLAPLMNVLFWGANFIFLEQGYVRERLKLSPHHIVTS